MILDFVDEPFGKEQLFQEMFNYFNNFEKIILYHGTTNLFKDQILSEGLKARKFLSNSVYEGKKFNGKSLESNPNLVYVGSLSTANWLGLKAVNKYGGDLIIFKLLLDKKELLPDEDSKKTGALESLVWEGSAAINSKISPERIIGYNETPEYYGKESEREFLQLKYLDDIFRFTNENYKKLLN